jgi:hypothetical protein
MDERTPQAPAGRPSGTRESISPGAPNKIKTPLWGLFLFEAPEQFERLEFDPGPDGGSRSDTTDGENAGAAQPRSPQGDLRSKSAISPGEPF